MEVHHIVEKRFYYALDFGKTCSSMPSIALPKDIHRNYTNEWHHLLEYGKKTPIHQKDLLLAALSIYENDPELLGSAIYIITKRG